MWAEWDSGLIVGISWGYFVSYTLKHPLHSFCNLNFMSRFHCNLHFKLFVHGKFPGFPHAHTNNWKGSFSLLQATENWAGPGNEATWKVPSWELSILLYKLCGVEKAGWWPGMGHSLKKQQRFVGLQIWKSSSFLSLLLFLFYLLLLLLLPFSPLPPFPPSPLPPLHPRLKWSTLWQKCALPWRGQVTLVSSMDPLSMLSSRNQGVYVWGLRGRHSS